MSEFTRDGMSTNTTKLRNDLVAEQANQELKKAAEVMRSKLPTYKHSGSYAIHCFWSDLAGAAWIIQLDLGDTKELVVSRAHDETTRRLMESFGRKAPRKVGDPKIEVTDE